MAPRKQNSKKNGALVRTEFQLNEIVFAEQKGYAPWPAIITEFHPLKPRCAKVEFFAWNQQWAYVSFNSILKKEAGESIAENRPNNIKLQKAVKEMKFVVNATRRLLNDRIRENGFDVGCAPHIHSSTESNVATIGQSESIQQNRKRTKSKEPVSSIVELENRPHTRSLSRSSSTGLQIDVVGSAQPNSTKSKVAKVERSSQQQERGTKSKDRALSNHESVNRVRTRSQNAQTLNKPEAKRSRK